MPTSDSALIARNEAAMNEASPLLDKLSKTWDKIEGFFRKSGILREVSISFAPLHDQNTGGGIYGERLISLQKFGGSWKVCYGEVYYQHDEVISWKPVGESPADIRIELLEHVNRLFEALVKSNEEYVAEIRAATQKAEEIKVNLDLAGL